MMIAQNIQVMAFDFGITRIGVAIGNTLLKIPHPLDVISGKNKFDKLDKIAKLVEKWQPTLFVVGLPSYSADKENLLIQINKFANRLQHRFKYSVEFVNEDYTSSTASAQLEEQFIRGYIQKTKLDQLAACAILNRYFVTTQATSMIASS
jgi:putative holliday junction resolvase